VAPRSQQNPPTESFIEVALAVGAELAREVQDQPATPLVAAATLVDGRV
jgi:hypothetical protein